MKRIIVRIFIALAIFLFAVYFSIWLWVASRVNIDTKTKSDVIVVLGARIYLKPNVLNPCMVARVDKAVSLYKKGYASKVIFSGGIDQEDGIVEAEAMKQMAIGKGIPKTNILVESRSKSTFENILNSQEIMNKNSLKTAIIVTEPFHTPRAALVAKKQKINFTISPAYSSCWNDWRYLSRFLAREPAAMVDYFLRKKI